MCIASPSRPVEYMLDPRAVSQMDQNFRLDKESLEDYNKGPE